MSDRIIRDEILESARWLDLPTDTHRLVFVALVLRADDYGNFEGGPRRLFRFMHAFSQVKTDSDAIKLMSDLQDTDLVRRYEVEGREYWHIPRFENKRQYWSRHVPKSPFQEQQIPENQAHRQKTLRVLAEPSANAQRGVGVGVGVGEGKTLKQGKKTSSPKLPPQWWKSNAGIDTAMRVLGVFVTPHEGYEVAKTKCFEALKGWHTVGD